MKASDTARFWQHNVGNAEMTLGPRHRAPLTDDIVVAIRHIAYEQGKSVLLTKAQVAELHEWLGRWLADGWDGVKRTEGPTSTDVIEHYNRTAIRARIEADHAHVDAARAVDAALALIPAELRSVDLTRVADEQSKRWARQRAEIEDLEKFRIAMTCLLRDIEDARRAPTGEQITKALSKAIERHNHRKVKQPDVVPDAPVYDIRQLDLFDMLGEAA